MSQAAETLGTASRSMNRDLLKLYRGDATAAEEAIAQLVAEPDALAGWATRMLKESAKEDYQERWNTMHDMMVRNQRRENKENVIPGLDEEAFAQWEQKERAASEMVKPFSWDEVPTSMKPAAVRGMAIAYLVQTGARP